MKQGRFEMKKAPGLQPVIHNSGHADRITKIQNINNTPFDETRIHPFATNFNVKPNQQSIAS